MARKYETRDATLGAMLDAKDPWNLDFPLFQWSPYDAFTLRNAVESVAIFGELGAAKTTGSAAWILLKYLTARHGRAGLLRQARRPRADRSLRKADGQGGLADRRIARQSTGAAISFAMRSSVPASWAAALSIVSLLMTIVEAAERGDAEAAQGEKFWQRSLRQILRNGLEVCIAARGEVTHGMLHEVITTAPRSHAEVHKRGMAEGIALLPAHRGSGRQETKPSASKAISSWRRSISCASFPTCRTIHAARSSQPMASWPTCCCAGTWRTCSTAKRTSFPI